MEWDYPLFLFLELTEFFLKSQMVNILWNTCGFHCIFFFFFFKKQAFKLVKTSLTQQMVQSEATDWSGLGP